MALHYEIDNTDIQILNILMENAFTPYTEVGKKLFISPGTVHVRMGKMEKLGIVKHPQLQLDLTKLGMDVTAFIGVYLIRSDMYDKVVTQLKKIDEVLSCNYTTGNYSLFLKIVCRDTQHLREVLHDKLQKIEGISRTETLISLEESFSRQMKIKVEKGK
ncbi:MAG TPA: Lrp/AsnC ligand binding domain-containing protein [Chitinophagales bacterium]|nr:Lrp/AsnC ligand binding domain-containing protein [Chitinophagales bacterium]HLP51086.1 Lrp/AsnC ligand binding domain-containing protein [Chitinophagales bacterium]